MTPRPDLLVSATWLFITLWCVAGSVTVLVVAAWIIANAVEGIVSLGEWGVSFVLNIVGAK